MDAAFALQQIEGWQKARHKIPSLAADPHWHWPVRLSMEQCSSELTARYKSSLLPTSAPISSSSEVSGFSRVSSASRISSSSSPSCCDLTGGAGIDSFFLSRHFSDMHYVEQNEALCALARHNMPAVRVHNCTAEQFLSQLPADHIFDCIYLDPARRDRNGGKVFRLSDCTPDVTILYDELIAHSRYLLIKLSPMLDITEALTHLPAACEVHVVAVENEVKEILILAHSPLTTNLSPFPSDPTIHAVNLRKDGEPESFSFRRSEEDTVLASSPSPLTINHSALTNSASAQSPLFLFEPNAAILKAGAYKLIAERYHLTKLAPNSHLYAAAELPALPFPGRIFRAHVASKEELKSLTQANIICRNYPLKPEELKKKLHIKDGGTHYILGTRMRTHEGTEKPVLFLADRLN